jgi:hypothetical protein
LRIGAELFLEFAHYTSSDKRKSESLAVDKAVLTIKAPVAATQTPLIHKMSRMVLAREVPYLKF